MIISKEETLQLLPQKHPFIAVDQLVEFEKDFCTSSFEINKNHPLLNCAETTAGLLIENMAQTAALHLSYSYFLKGVECPIGFIVEVKNLEIKKHPSIGDRLTTKIKIETEILNYIIAKGEIYLERDLISSCSLKVVLNNPPIIKENE